MGLRAALAPLEALIVSRVTGTTFRVGAQYLAENAQPPRVVWVPLSEGYQRGPARAGTPRATGVRTVTVGARLWGADFDAAEALVDALLWAAQTAAAGSYSAGSVEWERGAHLQQGEAATLELTLNVPVLDTPAPTVTVTAVAAETAGATRGDNVLETGDA